MSENRLKSNSKTWNDLQVMISNEARILIHGPDKTNSIENILPVETAKEIEEISNPITIPEKQFIIVRDINGVRSYLSDIYPWKLGTWTRKRKKAHVFPIVDEHNNWYSDRNAIYVAASRCKGTKDKSTSDASYLSYRNRAHTYYGLSYYAIEVIRWLYELHNKELKGDCVIRVVDLSGNKIVWSKVMKVDLTNEEPLVKKERSKIPNKK